MLGFYWLHVMVVAAVVVFVIHRYLHNMLSPVPAFCTVLTYMFYSDFLVRGYDDELIAQIPPVVIIRYQSIVLLVYLIGIAFALSTPPRLAEFKSLFNSDRLIDWRRCEMAGWGVVFADVLKRLYTTDWSVATALSQSIGARGVNSWSSGGALGNETFIFSVTLFLLPAGGLCFGTLLTGGNRSTRQRIRSLVGFALIEALLFTYGSRTYFAVPLLYYAIRYSFSRVGLAKKLATWFVLALLVAVTFSVLLRYRSAGIDDVLKSGKELDVRTVQYHQDDSYYRILYAAYVSDQSTQHPDAGTFFTVIALNPVPRIVWRNKPALFDEYWMGYKDYYVTITFVGELIALFGVWPGALCSLVAVVVIQKMVVRFFGLINRPFGFAIYFISLLYCQQCVRSLMAFTMSMYPLVGVIGFSLILTRRRPKWRNSTASPATNPIRLRSRRTVIMSDNIR